MWELHQCEKRHDLDFRLLQFQRLIVSSSALRRERTRPSVLLSHLKAYVLTLELLEGLGFSSEREDDDQLAGAFISADPRHGDVPIVIDTGCSHSVTPFLEDFSSELEPTANSQMNGLKDSVAIKGDGWVDWPIRDIFGRVALVRTRAYYIPEAKIRLFSSQTYFQENDAGRMAQDGDKIILTTAGGDKLTFNYQPCSNLPCMFLDYCALQAGLSGQQAQGLAGSDELEQMLSLIDNNNYNLTKHQKELLLWHYRLGHAGFSWIQELMREAKREVGGEPDPPVIRSRTDGAHKCEHPKCPACQLSKQHRKTPDSQRTRNVPEREMAIRRNNLQPGECVSMDQYCLFARVAPEP